MKKKSKNRMNKAGPYTGPPSFLPITPNTLPHNYFISTNPTGPVYLLKMPEGIVYEAPYLGAGFVKVKDGLRPENIPKRVDTLYNSSEIQLFCMAALTQLDNLLYSMDFRSEANMKIPFDFFLKGGNTIALHLPTISQNTFFPYDFQGDFDCSVLVNPDIPDRNFIQIRNRLIITIVTFLQSFISIESTWANIPKVYTKYGLIPNKLPNKINIFNEALTVFDFTLASEVYESPIFRTWQAPNSSPFRMEIHPNLTYNKESLSLALIKVRTNTEPSMDVIDISIPTKLYKNMNMEWDIHRIYRFELPKYRFRFNVSDIVSSYLDQKISALLETNNVRRQKRTLRASKLQNSIQRLLKNNIVNPQNIEYLRGLPYTIKKNVTLKSLLKDL